MTLKTWRFVIQIWAHLITLIKWLAHGCLSGGVKFTSILDQAWAGACLHFFSVKTIEKSPIHFIYELCFRGRMRSLGNSSVNCVKSFRISTGGFFLRNEKFQKYTRCREQKADVANLRKDFISLKEYNRVQVRTRLYKCNCTIVLHDDDASIRWGALNMFWRQCWWKYQRWEEKFQEFNSGGKII